MTRLLAFDYGRRRIGVATGNTVSHTAQAIATLPAAAHGPDWRRIEELIREWRAEALVVGLPLQLDGAESDACRNARRFGGELNRRFALPVAYVDERYSSTAADQLLRETAESDKSLTGKRKSRRDALAAELILGTYFEQTSHS
ncbi:MAG: Holliday junction resolvase RuvX [Pseudomonadota bacterium]|nr:Holliday junction resolvase RuvX [Pseudomonadota bacterium]